MADLTAMLNMLHEARQQRAQKPPTERFAFLEIDIAATQEFERNLQETVELLEEYTPKEEEPEIGELVAVVRQPDGHASMECHNCYISVYPNPNLIQLIGQYCCANCALRGYIREFEDGEISEALASFKFQRVQEFFGNENFTVEAFPPFDGAWVNDVIGYHWTKVVPPAYPIEYFHRHDSESYQSRKVMQLMAPDEEEQVFTTDQMELN